MKDMKDDDDDNDDDGVTNLVMTTKIYQANPDALVSGLGGKTTAGQSNSTESPLKPHRCGNRVVITLKILMPLGLLRNEMIKK